MFDQFFALNPRLGPPSSCRSLLQKRGPVALKLRTSQQRWRDILIPTARVFSTHQGLLGSLSCTRVLIELASNDGSGEKCRKVSEILIFLLHLIGSTRVVALGTTMLHGLPAD